jgi:pantoate kinase
MALFVTKKGVNPHTRYPDAYYGRIAFDKRMFDGIELVAKMERVSKKKAARLLIERGFSSYMGEKLKTEMALRELERKPHLARFVLELRRFARERGMDISKFI